MYSKLANIPVARSLIHLGEIKEDTDLPLTQLGTTFTMAQQACWVSLDHFAIGRWDGSISIFNKTDSTTLGPVISIAVSAPADQGIQMLDWVAENTFISSNDASSMVVWKSPSGTFEDLITLQTVQYNSSYGIANCSTVQNIGKTLYLITGHENGFLLIWNANIDGTNISLIRAVDLTSSKPVNPWGLQNIRGVDWFISNDQNIQVVTGSENGEICVVDVPSGNILSRTLFNPSAQRGINAISVVGQNLLVANCSVGKADKNLWYYWIDGNDWKVTLRDSLNLIVDNSRPQVFNFDVVWAFYSGGICFFSATEEGELWMGTTTTNNTLSILGNEKVAVADLGASLAAGIGSIVYAAYNVTGFKTYDNTKKHKGNPNRIDSLIT
ncbi:hypothetical protein [Maribacter sp. 2304DJ31-5]|uniref:hypothetical protein n=1 Tax=Maribacter sp. 2304DJ31-5 TaxID=3386273 RepID=UPI0039BC6796